MISNKNFFCSWSGGKDSCLALYKALQQGGTAKALFTMFSEDGTRTRSHGLDEEIIAAQAKSLNIPTIKASATWNSYEAELKKVLIYMKDQGVGTGVFGDIDLQAHRDWVEGVCGECNIEPYLPLWKMERIEVLNEFINSGFRAIIVALRDETLDKEFLGRVLDQDCVKLLQQAGVDPCGENGEFHTVVIDGPIFSSPINIKKGDITKRDGYWFLDVSIDK